MKELEKELERQNSERLVQNYEAFKYGERTAVQLAKTRKLLPPRDYRELMESRADYYSYILGELVKRGAFSEETETPEEEDTATHTAEESDGPALSATEVLDKYGLFTMYQASAPHDPAKIMKEIKEMHELTKEMSGLPPKDSVEYVYTPEGVSIISKP